MSYMTFDLSGHFETLTNVMLVNQESCWPDLGVIVYS